MVEFALVAPILFAVIFGGIDLGRAFHYWNVEQQMANDGARLAAVNFDFSKVTCPGPTAPASLAQYIQCQADTNELSNTDPKKGTVWLTTGAQVCIDFPNGTATVGDPVRVRVTASYNWLPIHWYFAKTPPTSTAITGVAYMRLEARWPSAAKVCYPA
jgi:Flp pilus assembly protein TadG